MTRLTFVLFLLAAQTCLAQNLRVVGLRCEGAEAPVGVERLKPSLSWQIQSTRRGVLQTAYQILVADDSSLLRQNKSNVWDSKKIFSGQSLHVAFGGESLSSGKTYYWKARVWSNQSDSSAWSETAKWQMGLLKPEDWKGAKWIAYETLPDSLVDVLPSDNKKDKHTGSNALPLLRKTFTVKKAVKKATAFVCGLGQFEFSLNGEKVGDHFLDPAWTKYDRQALYVPFDVTARLQKGANAIGVMLGNGFYYVPPVSGRYRKLKTAFGYPKLRFRMAIEYTDGSIDDIVSDESWRTSISPVTFSSIYGGEDYDARLEQKGWNAVRFDAHTWKQAAVTTGPAVLNAQTAAPLKVLDGFLPGKPTQLGAKNWVYDAGQNASGIVQISVRGKRGDTVRIYPAELLKADGSAAQRASGGPYYFQYILKGDNVKSTVVETWQPRFTYYGFRYLEVMGAVPAGEKNDSLLPEILSIKALHTRNAASTVGQFRCSNELFNRTFSLIDWAVKSNAASVFTDCPHREKLGWLEQDHLMASSILYNYDEAALLRKQLQDIRYSQTAEGLVPEIAPEYVKFDYGDGMFRDSPEWGSAAVILPWYLYQWTGDKNVLSENYDVVQRYVSYLQTKAKGNILKQGLGDWYDLGPKPPGVSQLTPMGVTATAIYYYDLSLMTKIASLLGKAEEANAYKALATDVKKSFNDSFFHAATKQYATGSQTANAIALYCGLVEPQYREAVLQNLVADIRSRNNALTAGDIGYRYVLCALHEAGRDDVIFDMNSRSDVPGYGYQLAKGATALTESWAALPTVSNNHLMLGHLMEWFYRGLGGIEQADTSIGFKTVVIRPRIVGDVNAAQTSYESPYGLVATDWKLGNDGFSLTVRIPANTTAIVYLPAADATLVKEGGIEIGNRQDIQVLGSEGEKLKLAIGSGDYSFTVSKK